MCVFSEVFEEKIDKLLTGFAAGVMVAASVWSLLIPAMEQSENIGEVSFCSCISWIFTGNRIFTVH